MMIDRRLAATLLAVVSNSSIAANWDLVAVDNPPTFQVWVDSSSIEARGAIRKFWQQNILLTPNPALPRVARMKILQQLDCQAREETILAVVNYSKDGDVLLNQVLPAAQRQTAPVPPSSMDEEVMKFVCH